MQNFLRAVSVSNCSVSAVDLCSFLPSVAEIKSAHNLRKNLPNKVLADEVIVLQTLADYLLQITTLAKLHDDVYLHVSFVNDAVIVAYYVWVPQFPQNIDLRHNLLLFLFVHFSIVELFPYKQLSVGLTFDFAYSTETTCRILV